VALWSDGDLRLITTGPHALQELRTAGPGEAWLCTVGRAADDDDFESFCAACAAQSPTQEQTRLCWTTPAGRAVAFGWAGPLIVDGQPVDWSAFPHYSNAATDTPLGAETMTIAHQGDSLRLDLAHGRVLP
jgi:hypothetical protein